MSLITAITNPNEPVIGLEMAAESFKIDAGQYKIKIDPASNVAATESAAGLKLNAPVGAASTVTAGSYDPLTKLISVAVDGTAPMSFSVAALDDEGVTLGVNATTGNIELKNAAGAVVGSLPVSQVAAQQLTGGVVATGYELKVSNGGADIITPVEMGSIFPTAPAGSTVATMELLTKSGQAIKIKRATSSLGTSLNYWVIAL
jgi:hypothetical protein